MDNGLVLKTFADGHKWVSVLILVVMDNGLVLDLIRHY